jgi:hypothetical protein
MRTVASQGNGLRSLLVRVGVVLLLATGGIVVWGQPSMAATCSGTSCNDKDPNSYGCSSGATSKIVRTLPGGTTTIEVRYSSRCNAWWARERTDNGDPTCVAWVSFEQQRYIHSPQDGDYEWLETASQPLVGSHYSNCSGQQSWSYMIADSSSDRYRTCVTWTPSPTIKPTAGDYTNCTAVVS